MRKEELFLRSHYDDLSLGVSIRIPKEAKAIVMIAHGMAEHRRRYHDFVDYLCEAGYVCVIHDHRGHGESKKHQDHYGYLYENGADAIVMDCIQIIEYMKERFENLPLYLLGHSMGSLVVRNLMREHDELVDGLIVCGSPSENKMAKVGLALVKALKFTRGDMYRSKLIQKMAFGSHNQGILSPISENAWLCFDEEIVKAYDLDEGCGHIFTCNGFESLFRLMIRTYEKKGWMMKNKSVPILFIAGEEDPCIISKKAFEKAVNFMKERGYATVESKLYPKMRHEILNEVEKEMVWNDVLNWLENRKK